MRPPMTCRMRFLSKMLFCGIECAERGGAGTPAAPLTNDDDEASTMATPHPMRTDLTVEYVRSLLDYDPETGVFTWRDRPNIHPSVNARLARKITGASDNGSGYSRITIDNKRYYAHRLAWFYVHGEWPEGQIDHINGTPSDNRITNLRLATNSQNHANTCRRRDNTSGFKGVSWDKRRGHWRAAIRSGGKQHHLGYFNTAEEAHATYAEAARERFGEFGRAV